MTIYLGTQGWSYKAWNGIFYPENTSSAQYLVEYAKKRRAVEIDSTYYGIPRTSTVMQWRDATPDEFRFTAKVPQQITHVKMLENAESDMTAFLDAMSALGDKLGPLLLQFPYNFRPDKRDVLADFLKSLPPIFRYAVEVRQRGWLQDWFFDLLARHGVAFVLADYAYMPKLTRTTTDFAYIRWLGNRKDVPDEEYDHVRINRDRELDQWAGTMAELADRGTDIWGFANNHYMGHSPATLNALEERLRARGVAV